MLYYLTQIVQKYQQNEQMLDDLEETYRLIINDDDDGADYYYSYEYDTGVHF